MPMRISWPIIAVVLLAVGAAAGLALQRQRTDVLRDEIALLREQNRDIERLRNENVRLGQARISEAELARLRADHAAVPRLRGEVEQMKARLQEMERRPPP